MNAAGFWLRFAVSTAGAGALAVLVAAPHPPRRLGAAVALGAGAAAGIVLFGAVARRAPRLRPSRRLALRHCYLGICAAGEELVWRRVVLGELLALGLFGAVGVSTAAFALAHRRSRALHLATGGVFGGVYAATGVLAASIAAHWAYNALVAGLDERRPP